MCVSELILWKYIMIRCPVDLILFGCDLFLSIPSRLRAVLIVYSLFTFVYIFWRCFLSGLWDQWRRRGMREGRGVPVHTPFLPQYLVAVILVYRRVLYEQWQPRKMKEGRVFLRHGRSWQRRGDAGEKHSPGPPPPPRLGLGGVRTSVKTKYLRSGCFGMCKFGLNGIRKTRLCVYQCLDEAK